MIKIIKKRIHIVHLHVNVTRKVSNLDLMNDHLFVKTKWNLNSAPWFVIAMFYYFVLSLNVLMKKVVSCFKSALEGYILKHLINQARGPYERNIGPRSWQVLKIMRGMYRFCLFSGLT